jgi:hypothetical protein
MRVTNANRLRFLAVFAAMSIYSVQLDARRAPAAPTTGTFNHLEFVNTNGRVGYHMFSTIRTYAYDTPTGDAVACSPAAAETTSSGTIPAGLTLLANDQNGEGVRGFDGTPRQPGDWTVNVTVGRIRCQQGPDQTVYGPRTIVVHLHIDT